MNHLKRYRELLAHMLERREAGDEEAEERALELMDPLWFEMSEKDRDSVRRLSKAINDGSLSPDALRTEAVTRVSCGSTKVAFITFSSFGSFGEVSEVRGPQTRAQNLPIGATA